MIFCAYTGQTAMARALYIKPPSYVMPFNYLGIILASLFDMLIFNVHFDFLSVCGMLMTSVCLLSKMLVD